MSFKEFLFTKAQITTSLLARVYLGVLRSSMSESSKIDRKSGGSAVDTSTFIQIENPALLASVSFIVSQ